MSARFFPFPAKSVQSLIAGSILPTALALNFICAPVVLAQAESVAQSKSDETAAKAGPLVVAQSSVPEAAKTDPIAVAQNVAAGVPAKTGGAAISQRDSGTAAVPAPVARLEELNRRILLEEIQLEKHAINFRHYNNFQGRWKGWRYFLTQEANNDVTGSGLIVQLCERWRIYQHPYTLGLVRVSRNDALTRRRITENKIGPVLQRPNRARLEAGFYPQLVGQSLAGAGSALELFLNHHHQMKVNKAGYGCKESIKKVKVIRDRIDGLMAQRKEIIKNSQISPGDLQVADAEQAVLQDTTVLALREYEDVHVNAKRFRCLQESLYLFDMARNATGAAGNIVGIVAAHENSAYLGGPTNVLTTISGACGVVGPVASRLYGRWVGSRHRAYIRREIGDYEDCHINDYDMDRKNLQILMDAKASRGEVVSEKATAMLASYEAAGLERVAQYDLSQRDLRAGARAAQQNITVGCANGLTKVALGVTGIIAGYGLTTANHRANAVLIPGTITYIAGTWLSAGENIRLRIVDEINRKKLGKRELLPKQVLAARMKTLEAVETSLKGMQ